MLFNGEDIHLKKKKNYTKNLITFNYDKYYKAKTIFIHCIYLFTKHMLKTMLHYQGTYQVKKKDEYQNPTIKKSNLICLEKINTYTVKGDMGQNRDI